MDNGMLRGRVVFLVMLVAVAAIAGLELGAGNSQDASILITLTFFTMLVQGCVAVAAVGVLAKGLWVRPTARHLLSVYPALFVMAFLYLLMAARTGVYPWADDPNGWMNERFFIIRNFSLMMLTALMARAFAHSVMKGSRKVGTYAVFYMILWVSTESAVAFDWIMSLEYPWISTLFGGYFFIQSYLMGLIVNAIIIVARMGRGESELKNHLWDTGKMMFAFCFMWGGFMFTQYLVIWFGNIPEEVSFILKRVDPQPYWTISRLVLLMVFVIPFVTLVVRKVKMNRAAMSMIGFLVLGGLLMEKFLFVAPVAPINGVLVAVEFVFLAVMVVSVIRSRDVFMPQQDMSELGGARPAQ